ncbi:MAG: hypothetical protein FJ006_00065 [Chloroflexi bacterium]|nr:hypothetical protein [Chloroflexota bacterium]
MDLTPGAFAEQVLKWYRIWANANRNYFPVEEKLSDKASRVGYLNMVDLIEITRVLGNPHNIRGRVQTANTEATVIRATKNAILHLNEPIEAYKSMCEIRQWGLAYRTKTLRCICPRNYAALDSKIHVCIDRRYFPSRDEGKRYCEFLNFIEHIKQKVLVPGPRNGEWFIADIEMALFQFAWEPNNRIIWPE